MEARELRIGNLIYFTDYRLGFSNLLSKADWRDIFVLQIDDKNYSYREVPISEQILSKAKFVKQKDFKSESETVNATFIKRKHKNSPRIEIRTIINERLNINDFIIKVDGFSKMRKQKMSFHQLQNLYFALTGEELEINLH